MSILSYEPLPETKLLDISKHTEIQVSLDSLGIPRKSIPEYDPDAVGLAMGDVVPTYLWPLKESLRKFVKANSKYWSAASLSQFLNIDIKLLLLKKELRGFNTHKAQTILVLRTLQDAEADDLKYSIGKI